MPPKVAKLAGLGALGAIAVMIAIYAFVIYLTVPRPTSGIDLTEAIVAWVALGVVFGGMIASHLNLASQLMYLGKGGAPKDV